MLKGSFLYTFDNVGFEELQPNQIKMLKKSKAYFIFFISNNISVRNLFGNLELYLRQSSFLYYQLLQVEKYGV